MKEPIPLAEPCWFGDEAGNVAECLRSGWVSTSGPFVERFEHALAERVGLPHAVATQSGTAALHLALRALGIGPDDAVAVSTLSFIAPANAIRYTGALPIFVDAEAQYAQMDPVRLERLLRDECRPTHRGLIHRATGRRLRAVLPVHVLGHPADLPAIAALARRFDLAVVEDAAEAIGAEVGDRPAGSLGDVGCFSFNGNKTVTAGGGGALVCRDAGIARRAAHLASQAKADAGTFVHDEVGFNYRMTGLHAAVACAQLSHLDELLARKRAVRAHYEQAFASVPEVEVVPSEPGVVDSCWLTALRIDAPMPELGAVLRDLHADGIGARPLWQPLHQSPAHAGSPAAGGSVAERLHRRTLCLPSSAGLTERELDRVVSAVRTALARDARLDAAVA